MQSNQQEAAARPIATEQPRKPRAYRTRVRDGKIELFNGALVNRAKMLEILQCPSGRLTSMMSRENGLPHIRIGGRIWFDPDSVKAWMKNLETQANPTRAKPKRK
jgi:hypothetical protein